MRINERRSTARWSQCDEQVHASRICSRGVEQNLKRLYVQPVRIIERYDKLRFDCYRVNEVED
jgi:hypothetical protein